jgi:integrase
MKKALPKYTTDLKGAVYFRRHGKAQRILSEPFSDAFWAEYALMLKGIAPVPKGKLADLIASYKLSPKFAKLADRTRKDYDGVLSFLIERMGHVQPDRLKRKHVINLRDANAETVRFANYCVQVLRIVLEHGIDQGIIEAGANPAKGVDLLKSEAEPRGPWPQDKIDAFRAAVPLGHRTRTLFELLIGTGQRIGDVLKMQWNHIDDDGINVRQNKTGMQLWVPFTPHLRAALEAHRRDNLTILTKQHGNGPWAYRGAADALMAVRIEIGAEAYDAHSLRYSAACELLMNGCSDDLIAAVTGQSARMVAHYTKSVRQKVRAITAQKTRK